MNKGLSERLPALNYHDWAIIQACCFPDHRNQRQLAKDLHLGFNSIKVYYSRLYRKLGWPIRIGSPRMLALYGIAHREELGIDLPAPEQFTSLAARATDSIT